MSLGIGVRSVKDGNKELDLYKSRGKYDLKYRTDNQNINLKSNIEDQGYANYLFDKFLEDLHMSENKMDGDILNQRKEIMRELKYPAIYKHFKYEYYATMGVSKPINSIKFTTLCQGTNIDPLNLIFMSAKHTEKDIQIRILNRNGEWYHIEEECEECIVIYKALYDGSGAYARPVNMFLSEVDKVKYPNAKQKYRFEEIRF